MKRQIVDLVLKKKGIKEKQIFGRKRGKRLVCDTRMQLMFLIYHFTPSPLTEIGDLFNRHYTTVMNGLRQVRSFCEYYPGFADEMLELMKLVEANGFKKVRHLRTGQMIVPEDNDWIVGGEKGEMRLTSYTNS